MNEQGFRPCVYFLPEDEADEKIVNGFNISLPFGVRTKVLPYDRGYGNVRSTFETKHIDEMRQPKNRSRYMILIVDFDKQSNRLRYMQEAIPEDLKDRVFVLGSWSRPEDLKKQLGNFEEIGKLLAQDCLRSTNEAWGHELLRHNAEELERMTPIIKTILFPNL